MDKYDEQIERLTREPQGIFTEWAMGRGLFQYATQAGKVDDRGTMGCLTLIRQGNAEAETSELTAAIRADERIPKDSQDIRPEHLPAFAEWQRHLDKELNRC